jgi:hypothetical protein
MLLRPLLALLLMLTGSVAHAATNASRSIPVKICQLNDPIAIPASQTTTIRGCTKTFTSPLVHLDYAIVCHRTASDTCQYASYLASGDACRDDRPPVPKTFLAESVCQTSAENDCSSRLEVPAGSGDLAEICVVVSCLSSGGCPVNATIRLEGRSVVKNAAEIEEGVRREPAPKSSSEAVWALIAFAIAATIMISVAVVCVLKRQKASREAKVEQAEIGDGIWVLATGDDYDNRDATARDPTINDV